MRRNFPAAAASHEHRRVSTTVLWAQRYARSCLDDTDESLLAAPCGSASAAARSRLARPVHRACTPTCRPCSPRRSRRRSSCTLPSASPASPVSRAPRAQSLSVCHLSRTSLARGAAHRRWTIDDPTSCVCARGAAAEPSLRVLIVLAAHSPVTAAGTTALSIAFGNQGQKLPLVSAEF